MADQGTAARDVVVAGASAGGVEALATLVAGLPADLPAAVLVAMHLPETRDSGLAQILDRAGPLPATDARDGELLRPGRVYVGVADRHLIIRRDRVVLSTAPKQNRSRPSVDTLFRGRRSSRRCGPRSACSRSRPPRTASWPRGPAPATPPSPPGTSSPRPTRRCARPASSAGTSPTCCRTRESLRPQRVPDRS